mmetsp:Transcript_5576/g.6977  ORF Transcript_5576/g.6977 Transcript_5576/m.6977 type:complete len:453 (-) Transcript_5576:82-1440(-)
MGLNLIPVKTYISVACFILIVFIKRRKKPLIRMRNPLVLSLSALYNVLCSAYFWQTIITGKVDCHLEFFLAYSLLSLHVFPLVARGFRHVVLTNDSYRRRFPRFKSNVYVLKWCLLFLSFNSCVIEIFFWTSYRYKCVNSWDAVYALATLAILLAFASRISVLILADSDAFKIGRELKYCYYAWVFFGVLMIVPAICVNFIGRGWKKVPYIILIIMNSCTFLITIVFPLLQSNKFQEIKTKLHGDQALEIGIAQVRFEKMVSRAICRVELSENGKKLFLVPFHCSPGQGENPILLEDILNNKSAVKQLHDFARRHLVPELSLFLHAIHIYKMSKPAAGVTKLYEKYNKIVEDFIKDGSPYQVNISSKVKDAALAYHLNYGQFTVAFENRESLFVFDQAEKDVVNLFRENYGRKFLAELQPTSLNQVSHQSLGNSSTRSLKKKPYLVKVMVKK